MSDRQPQRRPTLPRPAALALLLAVLLLAALVAELRLALWSLDSRLREVQIDLDLLRQQLRARPTHGEPSLSAPVSGPGVVVVLDDSQAPPGRLLHDQDLLVLVNELRAAGATAIAVADQRLGALSEIRCAGNHIRVNGAPVAPPYVIRATGDPAVLRTALELRDGILDRLRRYGFRAEVREEQRLTIPPLR